MRPHDRPGTLTAADAFRRGDQSPPPDPRAATGFDAADDAGPGTGDREPGAVDRLGVACDRKLSRKGRRIGRGRRCDMRRASHRMGRDIGRGLIGAGDGA